MSMQAQEQRVGLYAARFMSVVFIAGSLEHIVLVCEFFFFRIDDNAASLHLYLPELELF